jgi:hypothetical protein
MVFHVTITIMSIPLFFPRVRYVARLALSARATTLRALCDSAGVACKASGDWTSRVVDLVPAHTLQIAAEPGDWSAVQISLPDGDRRTRARLALATMAYALHDLVARQSIMGAPWAKISLPRGRIASGAALSTVERQRRFRARQLRNPPKAS